MNPSHVHAYRHCGKNCWDIIRTQISKRIAQFVTKQLMHQNSRFLPAAIIFAQAVLTDVRLNNALCAE
jgi:hypothetical protein